MVAILFIFTDNYAQPNVSVSDQKTIDCLIYHLNLELLSGSINERKPTNRDTIDSVINESNSKYKLGHVTYTPDKKFKIFVLEGDDCGAHCSPLYQGYVYHTSGIKVDSLFFLLPISKIYKLPGGAYLVLGQGVEGGGNIIDDSMTAFMLSAKNGKLTQLTCKASARQKYSDLIFDDGGLKVSQPQYLTDYKTNQQTHLLYFSSRKNKLFFNFKRDDYIKQRIFSVFKWYF